MSICREVSNASGGCVKKWEDSTRNNDLLTGKVTMEEIPATFIEESGDAVRSEFQCKRKQWQTYQEAPLEIPFIERVTARPRGLKASFWENKISNDIESEDHLRHVISSERKMQKIAEEITRYRKPWLAIPGYEDTEKVAETSGEQPCLSDPSSDDETSKLGLSDSCSDDEIPHPAVSDSSTDEEYYLRIDRMKLEARQQKELDDQEMDEIVIRDLENLDVKEYAKIATDPEFGPENAAKKIIKKEYHTQPAKVSTVKLYHYAVAANEEKDITKKEKIHLAEKILAIWTKSKVRNKQEKVELAEEFIAVLEEVTAHKNNEDVKMTEVSGWTQFLKKLGLATIATSLTLGALYLLYLQAGSNTVQMAWDMARKILSFAQPVPEPQKSFLWKIFDSLIPTPSQPAPERYFLSKLFDYFPSLPFFR